jgi:hypothetical protein
MPEMGFQDAQDFDAACGVRDSATATMRDAGDRGVRHSSSTAAATDADRAEDVVMAAMQSEIDILNVAIDASMQQSLGPIGAEGADDVSSRSPSDLSTVLIHGSALFLTKVLELRTLVREGLVGLEIYDAACDVWLQYASDIDYAKYSDVHVGIMAYTRGRGAPPEGETIDAARAWLWKQDSRPSPEVPWRRQATTTSHNPSTKATSNSDEWDSPYKFVLRWPSSATSRTPTYSPRRN